MPFGGEDAESYYDDGLTASIKGDLSRAVQCFEQAIRKDNSFAAAYHQLGKVYLRMGQAQRAVDLVSQVVKKRPTNTAARLDLGYALMAAGMTQEARKEFDQLLAMEPSNARALLGMAQLYYSECDWQTAASRARVALNMGGTNFAVLFLLGRAAKNAGDSELAQSSLEAAEKLLEKSTDMTPDQPESFYLRGEVAFVREQFLNALEHYRHAEDRTDAANPGRYYMAYGESFTHLDVIAKEGLCYQRLGKPDRAREIGLRIVQRDPNHRLGQALAEIGS